MIKTIGHIEAQIDNCENGIVYIHQLKNAVWCIAYPEIPTFIVRKSNPNGDSVALVQCVDENEIINRTDLEIILRLDVNKTELI